MNRRSAIRVGTGGLGRTPAKPRPLGVGLSLTNRPVRTAGRGTRTGTCASCCYRPSNLRQPALKRIMPERLMLAAEYVMQVPFAPLAFGPSLFFMARHAGRCPRLLLLSAERVYAQIQVPGHTSRR